MCLTTPARIVRINGNKATIKINGRMEEVRTDMTDVKVGDVVYCAAGMVVEKADS